MSPKASRDLKRTGGASGRLAEPVSYVGRIIYSEDAVELTDRVFCFIPLEPGLERALEPPSVESPDSYVP
jgi:hypothetical protein